MSKGTWKFGHFVIVDASVQLTSIGTDDLVCLPGVASGTVETERLIDDDEDMGYLEGQGSRTTWEFRCKMICRWSLEARNLKRLSANQESQHAAGTPDECPSTALKPERHGRLSTLGEDERFLRPTRRSSLTIATPASAVYSVTCVT